MVLMTTLIYKVNKYTNHSYLFLNKCNNVSYKKLNQRVPTRLYQKNTDDNNNKGKCCYNL